MTAYLVRGEDPGVIHLLLRAESGDGAAAGDAHVEVRPGRTVFGRDFAWWSARPDGPVTIGDDGTARDD